MNNKLPHCLSQSLLETEGQEEQVFENQSPISNITRRTISNHPTLTPKHSERAFFPDTIQRSERNSVGRLGGIGWINIKNINNPIYTLFLLQFFSSLVPWLKRCIS